MDKWPEEWLKRVDRWIHQRPVSPGLDPEDEYQDRWLDWLSHCRDQMGGIGGKKNSCPPCKSDSRRVP